LQIKDGIKGVDERYEYLFEPPAACDKLAFKVRLVVPPLN